MEGKTNEPNQAQSSGSAVKKSDSKKVWVIVGVVVGVLLLLCIIAGGIFMYLGSKVRQEAQRSIDEFNEIQDRAGEITNKVDELVDLDLVGELIDEAKEKRNESAGEENVDSELSEEELQKLLEDLEDMQKIAE